MKVVRLIFLIMLSILKQEKIRGDFFKQTGKHPPQLRYFVLLLLSLVILIAGCATTTVRLPSVQEEESIQLKEKAIVLLRFKADMDGKPLDYGHNGFMLALANMDETQYLKIVEPGISPSSTARDKGWMYLVLKPGTYYLSVRPPGRKQIPPEREQKLLRVERLSRYDRYEFKPIPPFWFHVPAGSPVVYVGSLSVSCMARQKKFNSYISEYSEITVTNESDSAKKITRASFSQYGRMSTSLTKQYAKPVTPFAVGELVPMGIKITPLNLIKQDEFSATGVDATYMGRSLSIIKSIAIGSLKVTGVMCIEFINLYGIVYGGASFFPGEITLRLIEDDFFEGEEKSRQELKLQDFHKPTDYLDPKVTLLHTLKEMLPKYGVHQTVELVSKNDLSAQASIHKLKTVLQAEILRVRLRLCEISSYYCIELSVRIKLLDISTNKYLYDGILISTSPFGREKDFHRSFALPIFESSDCRNIEDYYGKEGLKVIEEEIAEALKLSIEKVCNDLGLYEQPIVEHTYLQTIEKSIEDSNKTLEESEQENIINQGRERED